MTITDRKCICQGNPVTLTKITNDYVYFTLSNGNTSSFYHFSFLYGDRYILRFETKEINDFVEITTETPYGNIKTYGQISSIESNYLKINNLYKVPSANCRVILPSEYHLMKTKPVTPLLDSVGAEFEHATDIVEDLYTNHREHIQSKTRETDKIKELQMKPINTRDFKKFLEVYTLLAEKDKFEYAEGSYTPLASSMHTHLSFYGTTNDHFYKHDWLPVLSPFIFSKRYGEYIFRSNSIKHQGLASLFLNQNNPYPFDSKSYAITINSVIKENTIEYRINENPLPLWIYLVPVLLQNNCKYTKLTEAFKEDFYEANNQEQIFTDKNKKLCKKALKQTLALEKEVLDYWKGKVKYYSLFRKVMKEYFRTKLNSKKTLKFIKGL